MTQIQTFTSHNETSNTNAGIFGLNSTYENSEIILIPSPWEVTTSYRQGTAQAPAAIKAASYQCDVFNPSYPDLVHSGIYYCEPNNALSDLNNATQPKAAAIINKLEKGDDTSQDPEFAKHLEEVNAATETCIKTLYEETEKAINADKSIGIIGGDHSCSLGPISALIDYVDSFGVLQLDAHMDLRKDYQGFTHSHASVMRHVLDLPDISRIVQVGIREFCEEEHEVAKASKGKIKTFYNDALKAELFAGRNWETQCKKIVNNCPDNVYVSLDIDSLKPCFCPQTGTPVPGGLDYDQVTFLLTQLAKSGKQIIGFDLVEVSGEPNSLDAIIAARLLYHLCGCMWLSQQ